MFHDKFKLATMSKEEEDLYTRPDTAAINNATPMSPRHPFTSRGEEAAGESSTQTDGVYAAGKTATGSQSEHGHDLTRILPMTKHQGKSVTTFFNGLFQTMIAIGTLGTSVTFSYVLSNNTQIPEAKSRYSTQEVQTFLSISWLLFLLTLAFACLGSTLLTFFKKHWILDWDGEHGRTSQRTVQLYAVSVSVLMGGLVVGAFLILCLVVVAYSPVVGWIALVFTCGFGVVIAIAIINQVPRPWRNNTLDADKDSDV